MYILLKTLRAVLAHIAEMSRNNIRRHGRHVIEKRAFCERKERETNKNKGNSETTWVEVDGLKMRFFRSHKTVVRTIYGSIIYM